MPIEIKELVIRTVVDGGPEPEGGGTEGARRPSSTSDPGGTEELVQECVREVLRVLARSRER